MTPQQQGGNVAVWVATSPADVDSVALVRLAMMAWGRRPAADELSRKTERLQVELDSLDPACRVIVVAGAPAAPVGWCQTWQDDADRQTWWLVGVVVDPSRRRRGIATALARKVETYARDHGAAMLRSQTHADNPASIQFHQAMGFVNDGELSAPDGDRVVNFHRCLT